MASSPLSPCRYDSGLTDAQWQLIEPLLPPPATAGGPEKHPRGDIVNATRFKGSATSDGSGHGSGGL